MCGRVPGLPPVPWQLLQGASELSRSGSVVPSIASANADRGLRLEVGAAARLLLRAGTPGATAATAAEHAAEDVAEVEALGATRGATAEAAGNPPGNPPPNPPPA